MDENVSGEMLSQVMLAVTDSSDRRALDARQVERLAMIVGHQRVNGRSRSSPSRELLTLSGNKWTLSILRILSAGAVRHFALQNLLGIVAQPDSVSHRVMDYNLHQLEHNGIVSRRVTKAARGSGVEYELTVLGRALLARIDELVDWAADNSAAICRARNDYQLRRVHKFEDVLERERIVL